jgi:prolyl-tRNA editing enzyme YbaK/EbsC (Cys-tRNA(Pro) deacylase)
MSTSNDKFPLKPGSPEWDAVARGYFGNIVQDIPNFDKQMFEIAEDPGFRFILGLKDRPQHHAAFALDIGNGLKIQWDVIQGMTLKEYLVMAKYSGKIVLYCEFDDRVSRVRSLLSEKGVDGVIVEHLNIDGSRAENAARALGVSVDAVIRCSIYMSRKKEAVAVIASDNRKIDVKRVESTSGLKKLSIASGEEIERITGFTTCVVPPIAVLGKIPTFIDDVLLAKPYLVGSAGSPRASLKVSPGALVAAGMMSASLT